MRRRRKMSLRGSKKHYRKHKSIHPKNRESYPTVGGFRM